jgi:hypothetical protein
VSVIRPPKIAELLWSAGLRDEERRAVHDEAYRLMIDGRSLGVGEEEREGGFTDVFVLDITGNRYTVTRNSGAYLLLDPALGVIAVNEHFDDVVEALRSSL